MLLKKFEETVAELGGDQILMQGGLHPDATNSNGTKNCCTGHSQQRFPQINHSRASAPPEIYHFTKVNETAAPRRSSNGLKNAGPRLSLPGGGGEILVDRVRGAMTRGKVMTDDWLERDTASGTELGGHEQRRR